MYMYAFSESWEGKKKRLKEKERRKRKEDKRPVIIDYWEIQLEAEQIKSITFPVYQAYSPYWSIHQSTPCQ